MPPQPDLLDQLLRLHGAESLGRRYVFVRLARINIAGHLDYSETSRILSGIRRRSDWSVKWLEAAARHERLAVSAAAAGAVASAGDGYLRAALCAHWAIMFGDDRAKSAAHGRCLDLYARGAGWFEPPAARAEIPFDGDVLPAWVRHPRSGAGRGVALLIGGADTTKEELHHWGTEFTRRDLHVVAFDGPGQGELAARYGRLVMRFDGFHRAVAAVVDWVEEQPWAGPVGVFGNSLGGYLGLDAGLRDPRILAVISNGGFAGAGSRERWPAPVVAAFRACLGTPDDDATLAHIGEHVALTRVPRANRPAVLVVHGGQEDLAEEDEARTAAELTDGTLLVMEDGWHTCTNRDHVMSPVFADWMASALDGKTSLGFRRIDAQAEEAYERLMSPPGATVPADPSPYTSSDLA